MPETWVETIRNLSHPSPEAVEGAVVHAYLDGHDLTSSDPLLRGLVDHPERPEVTRSLQHLAPPSIDDVVKAFETIIPAADADANGAVFTPSEIADHMASEALTVERLAGGPVSVLDPACGCGALLAAALRRTCEVTGLRPSEVLPSLHGVDVDASSIQRAHGLLSLVSLHLGEDTSVRARLDVDDSLQRTWSARYDVVVANPPYVRYQNLPAADRERLSRDWATLQKGSPNLFFAFFELLEKVQAPLGAAAFITPNNFFATQSAAPLREWLAGTGRLRKVVDFGHNKVFDALTYTTITILGGPSTEPVEYALVTSAGDLPHLARDDYAQQGALGRAPWQLTSRADQENINKILGAGQRLDTVADIRYGVKTCRDRVYLVDGPVRAGYLTKTYEGVAYPIEEGVTVPHLVVPDARHESSIPTSTQRIIHPYTIVDGKAVVIPEGTMQAQYPKAYAYLQARKNELDNRDKGKKTYATWYAYARTQALIPQGTKLLTPEYAGRPRFMRDDRTSLYSNGCSITPKGSVSVEALQVVLESGILHYFVDVTSTSIDGGYKSYQKSRIAPFGVVDLTNEDLELFTTLSPGQVDDFLAQRYEVDLPDRYRRA